jgi:ABC-2 type transport system ATP-binding protein
VHNTRLTALKCSHLAKAYKGRTVLEDVGFQLEYGEILAILGRNGAGKTTLTSIACGLEQADSGDIRTAGMIPSRAPARTFGRTVGLAPQQLGIYPQLSVIQNLTCTAMLHGLTKTQAVRSSNDMMDMLGLHDQRDIRAEHLSGGQQRRLHTAMAIVHHPTVLFLDEPTAGADVEARAEIIESVKELAANGTAVVYTTHYLEEVESLQANVAFLVDGRIVDRGDQRTVVAAHTSSSVHVRFVGDHQPVVEGWNITDGHLEPQAPVDEPGQMLASLLRQPATINLELQDVQVIHANLENAYLNIVGSTPKKAQA